MLLNAVGCLFRSCLHTKLLKLKNALCLPKACPWEVTLVLLRRGWGDTGVMIVTIKYSLSQVGGDQLPADGPGPMHAKGVFSLVKRETFVFNVSLRVRHQ